jgi:hypothetical protein
VGRPRYDIRVIGGSPIFGIHDLPSEFAKTGGVILWRGTLDDAEIKGLSPTQRWDSPNKKTGVFVFTSADLKLDAGDATITKPTTTTTSPATKPTTTSAAAAAAAAATTPTTSP